jgi:glycosyltransferase involved in cell wall biosynthesis
MEKKNIADALFVAFNAPEEMKSSLYHDKGKVIPNGIDPTIFASLPKPGDFLKNYPEMQGTRCFLFLGRLDIQQKGLDFLIPAFARLHREHPNTHLVLAGPDEDGGADTIRRLLNNLGLHSAVTITGLLAGQEKLAALQDADFFVLPSRFEGMSIALLEALYMGLPVLITDQVGLCRKIAEAGAGIVVFPDENSIYTGLYDLIKSEIGNQMREKGSELVLKNYTWDAIATDLINQIRESWDGTWLFT